MANSNRYQATVVVCFTALPVVFLLGEAFVVLPRSTYMPSILTVPSNESNAEIFFSNASDVYLANSTENAVTELSLDSFLSPTQGFFHGTVAALSVIVVSEIGDKTFFIAVVLAMKYSRIAVFAGSLAALVLMTALSACLGQVSVMIPKIYVHYISISLFVIFGMKMIKDGCSMPKAHQGEYEEVQKTIENREATVYNDGLSEKKRALKFGFLWVFAEAFALTFLAEWGDRSQITTIVLAARENMSGVIFGAVAGHAICTLLAVVGGTIIAEKISVRAVTIIGGFVFLAFAVWAIISGSGDETDEATESSVLDSTIAAKSVDVYQRAFFPDPTS